MSTYLNFGTIIATLTPKDSSVAPIQYKADTTWDEEEFLGEPQPAKERGRRFMSNDGEYSQVVLRYASNGKREFQVFDDDIADQLISWAQRNPTVVFDLAFRYQRDGADASAIRTQFHSDCFFENTPARVLSNDVACVKFTLNYGKLSVLDANGNPV